TMRRIILFMLVFGCCDIFASLSGANLLNIGFVGKVDAQVNSKNTEPGSAKLIDLGNDVSLEVVYIPPGDFKMGSTPEERAWATGREGGATPGTERESYEGEQPRPMRVKDGFW